MPAEREAWPGAPGRSWGLALHAGLQPLEGHVLEEHEGEPTHTQHARLNQALPKNNHTTLGPLSWSHTRGQKVTRAHPRHAVGRKGSPPGPSRPWAPGISNGPRPWKNLTSNRPRTCHGCVTKDSHNSELQITREAPGQASEATGWVASREPDSSPAGPREESLVPHSCVCKERPGSGILGLLSHL